MVATAVRATLFMLVLLLAEQGARSGWPEWRMDRARRKRAKPPVVPLRVIRWT
jgi:hypothetical protein